MLNDNDTKTITDLEALDDLLEDAKGPSTPAPGHLDRLKALINQGRPKEVHPSDQGRDPSWVADTVALCGDIAGYAKMFRLDKRDGHERSIDEVRRLLASLCRQRGTDAVFEMLIEWRGFRPTQLPKDVLATWSRLFNLPAGFFEPKAGAQ
jgi:hypothetical protein